MDIAQASCMVFVFPIPHCLKVLQCVMQFTERKKTLTWKGMNWTLILSKCSIIGEIFEANLQSNPKARFPSAWFFILPFLFSIFLTLICFSFWNSTFLCADCRCHQPSDQRHWNRAKDSDSAVHSEPTWLVGEFPRPISRLHFEGFLENQGRLLWNRCSTITLEQHYPRTKKRFRWAVRRVRTPFFLQRRGEIFNIFGKVPSQCSFLVSSFFSNLEVVSSQIWKQFWHSSMDFMIPYTYQP